jgi:hypothetical protein
MTFGSVHRQSLSVRKRTGARKSLTVARRRLREQLADLHLSWPSVLDDAVETALAGIDA